MKSFKQFCVEMMVANAAGASGGCGGNADATGPVAGYDKPMGKVRKRYLSGGPGSRKRWMKKDG